MSVCTCVHTPCPCGPRHVYIIIVLPVSILINAALFINRLFWYH